MPTAKQIREMFLLKQKTSRELNYLRSHGFIVTQFEQISFPMFICSYSVRSQTRSICFYLLLASIGAVKSAAFNLKPEFVSAGLIKSINQRAIAIFHLNHLSSNCNH